MLIRIQCFADADDALDADASTSDFREDVWSVDMAHEAIGRLSSFLERRALRERQTDLDE